MEQKYLIDTNVLIDAQMGRLSQKGLLYCIDLRKNYTIKIPDAIIAATALARNLILITGNEKDFSMVQNLTVVNLHLL
ncbi:MAG: PIN domain-containing protein [Bacteroidales bacterium]|nr:PIN domain-containing protein [Bacteroidales bacterium]MCL2738018.1 PIN domain-containing protein [Bacteroidales bacterium]